jgi:hypothetical protein
MDEDSFKVSILPFLDNEKTYRIVLEAIISDNVVGQTNEFSIRVSSTCANFEIYKIEEKTINLRY